ncbi:MAG: hypothetical protein IT186_11250 [Acidobacteria bacterium]|nr:hypothetical protein [Acidobacteriota bacterium]MCG3194623.1 hypothetical protein [Thermoanaerobaculia bacterium]MCK6682458.1 hypothetical protein [Thermoanaerobaculia bacterium]
MSLLTILSFLLFVAAAVGAYLFYNKMQEEKAKAATKGQRPVAAAARRERETMAGIRPEDLKGPDVPTNVVPGFRDMRWGQPPADGMAKVHEAGDDALYKRENDILRVGPAVANSILYGFYQGRFQAVMLEFQVTGFDALARHLSGEWGTPRVSKDGFKVVWTGLLAGDEATQAVLEKRVETKTTKLLISSSAIVAEREKIRGQTKV